MNTSSKNPGNNAQAFTLMDLLVMIATLAVLAAVVMPALAGIQNKSGRLDCANNLRQIGTASMVFAGENNGWFPVCTLGGANAEGARSNYLGGIHYTHYVYYAGTPNTQITTNEPPVPNGGGYQNLGYLFQAGLAGNGNIFYCPDGWGIAGLGADYYSPLLTTDSSGTILSSYFYNPRMLNAFASNILRRYQTVSQLEPHRLFAVDYIEGGTGAVVLHARDHGWNVLFTDGSVQFAGLSQDTNYLYNLVIQHLSESETINSYEEFDQVFDFLEQDH